MKSRMLNAMAPVLFLAGSLATTSAQPTLPGQIAARPLTQQEITDNALPAATQTSGGLFNVGIGQPAYLEAQVLSDLPPSDVQNVVWVLVSQPIGSTAAFEPSPILPSMPIYSPGDRGFYEVVGERQMLRPDVVGQYLVRATLTTPSGDMVLEREISGSTYLGNQSSCQLCHSGGFLPDKFGPWSMTHHAGAFTNAIDGWSTDHFRESCIKCHSVGYDLTPEAVNGGFDDVQADTGWVFPTEFVEGNYAAMPQALREKSNVQCENCHGPGSEHGFSLGNTNRIGYSMSAGDCAQCHDAEPYHIKAAEWGNSLHAVATRTPSGEGRGSCVRCHSAYGFVDYTDGKSSSESRVEYEAITCAACHDPHGVGNPHMLRKIDTVTLMDNITTVTNGGLGQLCMNCHISRQNAADYVETSSGSSRFGPHHGPQTDMLVGANAITYGKEIPSSAHRTAVENTCVACHLQEVGTSEPGFSNVGGHTFRNHYDGGTAETTEDDVYLVGLCSNCHGDIDTFNFKRADYDGDGNVEGVQTEVSNLLDQLGRLLPPIGSPEVSITSAYTRPQLRAAYNYLFVEEDGSHGVHNLAYAVGLLKASIVDLTDDADHDGLSDTWEMANFGSITLYDGNGDPDNDGVLNSLELGAATNPLAVDTDNDGFSDLAELQAGSDPTNPDDQPGFVVQIYTAAEVEFASEMGKQYQVQRVSEITGEWLNASEVVDGTGDNISVLTSVRDNGAQNYFRVVEVE